MDKNANHGSLAYRKAVGMVVDRVLSGLPPPASPQLLYSAVDQLINRSFRNNENYLAAALLCLNVLISLEESEFLLKAVHILAEHYAISPPITRTLIMEAFRQSDASLSVSCIFLSEAERICVYKGLRPPPRTFFASCLYKDIVKNRPIRSVVLGMGTNVHYNLGIASSAEVDRPRAVPVDAQIVKTSLTSSHSLLLSSDGRVFACGRSEGKRSGLKRDDVAASPQLVSIPKGVEIVDVAAGEGFSLFISRKSVYISGSNVGGSLGMGADIGPYALTKVPLPPLRELTLDEVVIGEKFTLITTSSPSHYLLSGKKFGKFILTNTFEFYEDFAPEWDDVLTPCDISYELGRTIAEGPHWGICTGETVSFSVGNQSYTVRFTLFMGLRYRFLHTSLIGEIVYVIDGTMVPLDVAEFNVDNKGRVLLRAAADVGTRKIHSIYRGQVEMWEKSEDSFEFSHHDKKKKDNSNLMVVFVLDPIPNTCFASSLSVSADGENALFVIGSSEERRAETTRDWACMRVLEKPTTDVPFDCRITLGGRQWACMSSILAIRVPDCQKFMNKAVFHVEEVFAKIPKTLNPQKNVLVKVAEMIVEYVRTGSMTWNSDIFEPCSTEHSFLISVLDILALQVLGAAPITGEHKRAVVPRAGESCSARINCVIECEAESGEMVELYANRQLLELHSPYFILAGRYEGRERFIVRAKEYTVRHLLDGLATPISLEQRSQEELIDMLWIANQYGLDLLMDDIIRAMFIDATQYKLSEVSSLYELFFCAQEAIVRELAERPDLLLMWTKSENISIELLLRVCSVIESKCARRDGIFTRNGLCYGQALRFTFNGGQVYDDQRFCFSSVQWDICRKYLANKGKEIDKHWEHVIKKWYDEEIGSRPMPYAPLYDPELRYAKFVVEKRTFDPSIDLSVEDKWLISVAESISVEESERSDRVMESGGKNRRRRRTDTERRSLRDSTIEHSESMGFSECVDSPTVQPEVIDELASDMARVYENAPQEEHIESSVEIIDIHEVQPANGVASSPVSIPFAHSPPKSYAEFMRHQTPVKATPEAFPELGATSPRNVPQPMSSQPQLASPRNSFVPTTPEVERCIDERIFPELGVEQTSNPSRPKKFSFTSSKQKFRPLVQEVEKPKESIAPWASSPPGASSTPLSLIQAEEGVLSRQSEQKRRLRQSENNNVPRKPQNWTESPITSPLDSPTPFSLKSIMNEEENRRKETQRIKKRPLEFVAAEERAMSELLLLYQQSHGDDVIVNVQRCAVDVQEPIWAQ